MVDREAQAIGHGTQVRDITTLDTLIGNTLLREKLLAGIGGSFAFLGLLLAAIGLFGLLNYSVTRRTKEIGIRAALGARPPSLVFLVLKDMFSMIARRPHRRSAASLALHDFRSFAAVRDPSSGPSGDDNSRRGLPRRCLHRRRLTRQPGCIDRSDGRLRHE